MRISILKSAGIFAGSFILILAFQNCSGTGLPYLESTDFTLLENVEIDSSGVLAAEGSDPAVDTPVVSPGTDPTRVPGDDTSISTPRVPGSDPAPSAGGVKDPGTDTSSVTAAEDAADAAAAAADAAAPASVTDQWLYIAGGRGHVPMSSVAICPPGPSAGLRQCPFFCYKGGDYQMHRNDAREYFAKGFDKLPNYGGGAVPGTCANPDLKLKTPIN